MSARWTRIAAVARLELAIQRREPLTALYLLVLGLLAMAFAAAGPVDLVRDRGAVPTDAAWSLMLATTALTAFGQVITTMVAATVVLRDRADRVDALLAVSRLTRREYLAAKLAAALCVLLVIYGAIPVGLVAGAVIGGGSLSHAVQASIAPFALVAVPTMLAVGALQFGVGVLSGRLWPIVGLGLLLIWLWTEAIAQAPLHAGAALLDPFGTAPLVQATARWTDAQRMTAVMPVTAQLLVNRLLWLGIGMLVAAVAVFAPAPAWRAGKDEGTSRSDEPLPQALPASMVRAAHASSWRGALATAHYVVRWMLRDTGWRVLTVLGIVNVAIHAYVDARSATDGAGATRVALTALQLHARLFLVLLATIYAGELVWREAEERSDAFFEVQSPGRTARLAGRIGGAFAAQCALVAALAIAAALAATVASGQHMALQAFSIAVLSQMLWPFASWLIFSLLVHVLVGHKVAAHLCCIGAWVLAVLSLGAARPAGGPALAWWVMPALTASALLLIRFAWSDAYSRRRLLQHSIVSIHL